MSLRRVSEARCERQTDDRASCGVPSLTMLGVPRRWWGGPSSPNIVKGGTHGERLGERARRSSAGLTDREGPGAQGAARLIWSVPRQGRFRLPDQGRAGLFERRRRRQRMGREMSTSCHPDMRGLLCRGGAEPHGNPPSRGSAVYKRESVSHEVTVARRARASPARGRPRSAALQFALLAAISVVRPPANAEPVPSPPIPDEVPPTEIR
jgi:hypothetical protein